MGKVVWTKRKQKTFLLPVFHSLASELLLLKGGGEETSKILQRKKLLLFDAEAIKKFFFQSRLSLKVEASSCVNGYADGGSL